MALAVVGVFTLQKLQMIHSGLFSLENQLLRIYQAQH